MTDQRRDERLRVASDAERARTEYQRREKDERLSRYYARIRPAAERATAERRSHIWPWIVSLGAPEGLRVLDVGCGGGRDLIWLAEQGVPTANLSGIDVHESAAETARAALPAATIVLGDGADLPFPTNSMDAAIQTVVLSSVVDAVARRHIAREMARVVRPGGLIISYDMIAAPSSNAHLVGIDMPEVHRLFADLGDLDTERITLAMPLASRLPRVLVDALNAVSWLRSHLLVVVRVAP